MLNSIGSQYKHNYEEHSYVIIMIVVSFFTQNDSKFKQPQLSSCLHISQSNPACNLNQDAINQFMFNTLVHHIPY